MAESSTDREFICPHCTQQKIGMKDIQPIHPLDWAFNDGASGYLFQCPGCKGYLAIRRDTYDKWKKEAESK